MTNEDNKDKSSAQAENNNIAIGKIEIGGDVSGTITIGNTGYTVEEVSVLVTQIKTTFQPKPFDGRCPYKGLDVFEEEDAELFFGREKLVDDLVSRVKDSRTVFVTGPSGSGKSSLVRAGLIHTLKQGANKSSERWLYATMKPGRDPIGELGRVIANLASSTNPEDEICAKAMTDTTIFARWCEIALKEGRDKRLVLFIDQFEEVFTQISKEEERIALLNLLTHAATVENGRVIILFSMRSDFVSNCATYPQLNALLNQQFVQIGAMQPEELVSAIAQPALRVGLRIDPDLIAQIINEMKGEPGALPLMQFALKDLFDSQQEKSGVVALTLNDYLQRGGIHKALERHADDSFSQLSKNEQELARSIFSGLIEIGRGTQDTRRTALFDELIPANTKAEDVEAIVQKLADARLITTDEQSGKNTITISHEKLIDAWPWLKRLVNENRDEIALQNEIAEDAKEWEKHKRDNSYLYGGARLVTAQEKIKKLVLSENAQAYLQTSIKVEENNLLRSKRTQIRIITGLLIFSTIVLGLLLFSLLQLKISRAQRLGSQAQVAFAEEDYNTALLYAYQSNLIHKNDAADLILDQIAYKNFALGKLLNGHTDSVTSLAWSADGQLASGSDDDTVILWDIKTGQPVQTLKGYEGSITGVDWSADGQLASSGSWDNTVIIWNLKTGQPAQTLKGHTDLVESVDWSSDGRLASGSDDNTVIIWDLKTGQPTQTLKGHTDLVRSVTWSADGQLASLSGGNGTIILWDLKTGLPARTMKGNTDIITMMAWSADGQLASGSTDGTVIIWDIKTGQPAQILKGHKEYNTSVVWSAEGQLASGSGDNTTILWDLKTGQPTQTLRGYTVAWSADEQLASGSTDGTVTIWNLKTGQAVETLEGYASSGDSLAWFADGQLAFSSKDHKVVFWDPETNQSAQTLKVYTSPVNNEEIHVNSVAWSAKGKLASGSDNGDVIIWDLKTGQPAQILKENAGDVTSVAWSADEQLASVSNGDVTIWNLKTGQPAEILRGSTSEIISVAWSADGRLASGSYDGTVTIWDIKTGQPTQILPYQLGGRSNIYMSMVWLSKEQVAVAPGLITGGFVIIWDLKMGQPIQILRGHTSEITSIAWSAEGQLASGSGDHTVIIWDITTGQPIQTLKAPNPVTSVAWSMDGKLASGSTDGAVIVWDIRTGQPVQTLRKNTDWVANVAWSPHGQLASGSWDGTVQVSRTDLTGKYPCDIIIRNMSAQEWLDYQGPFYIYRPACSNLYNPLETLNPFDYNQYEYNPISYSTYAASGSIGKIAALRYTLMVLLATWKGSAILLVFLLVFLTVIFLILRAFYKLSIGFWRRARDRKGIQT